MLIDRKVYLKKAHADSDRRPKEIGLKPPPVPARGGFGSCPKGIDDATKLSADIFGGENDGGIRPESTVCEFPVDTTGEIEFVFRMKE